MKKILPKLPSKFVFQKNIYQGNNSSVFVGKNTNTNEKIVMKLFNQKQSFIFDQEFEILNKVKGLKGFPTIIYADKQKNCSYVILKHNGEDLLLHWKKKVLIDGKFSF